MGVPPNGTFGYIWKLTTDDGPLKGDHQCLTQLYQSTISPEKDLASGLVGTLLICKFDAIDTRGRLVRRSCTHTATLVFYYFTYCTDASSSVVCTNVNACLVFLSLNPLLHAVGTR